MKTLWLGTVDSRAFIAVSPSFPHVCIPAAVRVGGLRTSAQRCVDPSIMMYILLRMLVLSRGILNYDCDDLK